MSAAKIAQLLDALLAVTQAAIGLAEEARAVIASDDGALVAGKLTALESANDALAARLASKLAPTEG